MTKYIRSFRVRLISWQAAHQKLYDEKWTEDMKARGVGGSGWELKVLNFDN